MKLWKPEELTSVEGDMMLLYGDSGVGKTVTCLQTAPLPILHIMAEGRDVNKMLIAADRAELLANGNYRVGFYEGWDDMIDMFAHPDNFNQPRTILVDSLSHLMSICLSDEIMEESYESAEAKKKVKDDSTDKDLTMRVKMSQEGYGTLANQMLRFTNLATNLTKMGKIVICLARTEDRPKFNRALAAGPSLKGKEYWKDMPGFFDFIGYVESRPRDEYGRVPYPPWVSFDSDGSFAAKWTGKTLPSVYRQPLHIEKIIKAARGK